MLEDLDEALNAQGTSLVFAELKDPVRDKIERYGLTRTIDPRHFFLGEPPFAAFREDHPMLLWLSDRSQPAADFVKQYLLTHSAAGNNISGNAVTVSASGLKAVYAGAASAAFYGVPNSDPRHPDVTGIAQHGVVYTGGRPRSRNTAATTRRTVTCPSSWCRPPCRTAPPSGPRLRRPRSPRPS